MKPSSTAGFYSPRKRCTLLSPPRACKGTLIYSCLRALPRAGAYSESRKRLSMWAVMSVWGGPCSGLHQMTFLRRIHADGRGNEHSSAVRGILGRFTRVKMIALTILYQKTGYEITLWEIRGWGSIRIKPADVSKGSDKTQNSLLTPNNQIKKVTVKMLTSVQPISWLRVCAAA